MDEPGTTEEAAERFMSRMIGDQRWAELPERVRAQRRSEGAALVGELTDLRNPPWHPDELRLPVVFGYGSLGRPQHQRGMTEAAAMVPGARLVVLEECGHDAPLWRADQFISELVEPVLHAAGAPWA